MDTYDIVVTLSVFIIAYFSGLIICLVLLSLSEDCKDGLNYPTLKQEKINELILFFKLSKEDAVFIYNNPLLYKDYQQEIINFLIEKQKR